MALALVRLAVTGRVEQAGSRYTLGGGGRALLTRGPDRADAPSRRRGAAGSAVPAAGPREEGPAAGRSTSLGPLSAPARGRPAPGRSGRTRARAWGCPAQAPPRAASGGVRPGRHPGMPPESPIGRSRAPGVAGTGRLAPARAAGHPGGPRRREGTMPLRGPGSRCRRVWVQKRERHGTLPEAERAVRPARQRGDEARLGEIGAGSAGAPAAADAPAAAPRRLGGRTPPHRLTVAAPGWPARSASLPGRPACRGAGVPVPAPPE